jgi:hypothetical protein
MLSVASDTGGERSRHPQHQRAEPVGRIQRVAQRLGRLVPADPADAVGHAQQAVVAQPLQLHGGGRRGAAPAVGDPFVPEVGRRVARVRNPALTDERQQVGCPPGGHVPPVGTVPVAAWVQERAQAAGDEAVRIEHVLVDVEGRVLPVEIAGPVAGHPLPQDQVLRPGRRTDRVGLHELQFRQRWGQRATPAGQ